MPLVIADANGIWESIDGGATVMAWGDRGPVP